ncbi:MAG: hypothetical protein ACLGSH_15455 [Acidobacteriota bacterium]
MARGLSRAGADAMQSATSMRRALRVERRTSTHAGGRTVPRTLPTMSMPILLRAGALAARVGEVDALAALADADATDATIDILQIQDEPAGDSPSAGCAPPDLQAAASALNLTCLSLAPRLAAAPSIRARVSPRAWLMPCVSRSSG